jgi:SAM-dependent methyltransferase
MDSLDTPRMYGDLAPWWPLLSPPEDYAEEAAMVAGLVRAAAPGARTLLELGSGGGHNAVHLRTAYEMTLVDLSPGMLEVSRRLNRGAEHVEGDMRTVRLDRTFDAVLVHDALDYLLTAEDVAAMLATAVAHLRPGGVLVLVPDHVRETFEEDTEHGGTDAADGSGIRYLAWTYDPDPDDESVVTQFAYLVRTADGRVTSSSETHRCGLFGQQQWLGWLTGAGFEASALVEQTDEDRPGRTVFVGVLSAGEAADQG